MDIKFKLISVIKLNENNKKLIRKKYKKRYGECKIIKFFYFDF